MQRDMKVGMAVGVALIGIVGALFFRREPESKEGNAAAAAEHRRDRSTDREKRAPRTWTGGEPSIKKPRSATADAKPGRRERRATPTHPLPTKSDPPQSRHARRTPT